MKKLLRLSILLYVAMCVSSCSSLHEDSSDSIDSITENENLYTETVGDIMISSFQNVSSATLSNSINGMYSNTIDIVISEEYIKRLKTAYMNASFSDDLKFRFPLYSISFFDSEGEIIEKWDIDTYRTIRTLCGTKFSREGQIDEILTTIEEKYDSGYNLLEQIPGEEYYVLISEASSGYFRKQVSDNFDDSIDYEVPENILQEIKNGWQSIKIEPIRMDYTAVYTINLYNNDGNGLYAFHIDSSNNVYTSTGYPLEGDFINNWVDTIIREALSS